MSEIDVTYTYNAEEIEADNLDYKLRLGIAHGFLSDWAKNPTDHEFEWMVKSAVKLTDMLLAELEKDDQ